MLSVQPANKRRSRGTHDTTSVDPSMAKKKEVGSHMPDNCRQLGRFSVSLFFLIFLGHQTNQMGAQGGQLLTITPSMYSVLYIVALTNLVAQILIGWLQMTGSKRHLRGVVTKKACAVPKEIAGSGCQMASAQNN